MDYLTAREAAEYLRVSVSCLAKWRCQKSDGPKFTRAGNRKILYSRAALEDYLARNSRRSTSDLGQ